MKAVSRPADNSKVIGLVVAVIVVFVFVVWRTMSALGGAAPPDPAGAEVKMDPAAGPIVSQMSADADIDVPLFDAATAPNPFHPDDIDGAFVSRKKFATQAAKLKHLRDLGQDTSAITQKDTTPVVSPPILEAPAPLPMVINGVILGANPVVVITVGDKEFVVDRGAKFGNGLRIRDVSSTQVVVEDGKETHYLKVGSRPEPPPPAKPALPPLQKNPPQVLPNGSF